MGQLDAGSLMTRRDSLKAAAGAFMILPSGLARGYAANEKLNIGVIGLAGMGAIDAGFFSGRPAKGFKMFAPPSYVPKEGENIAALCDVDSTYVDMRAQDYPKAKKYTDFRKMIEKEKLDAVSVATPDHMHAYISVWAMKHGLHVYCQKPLCKTVHEARIMTKVAAETKVVTQMGTQTSAAPNNMRTVELIQSGALGEIVECHLPSGPPIWPQGYDRPPGEDPVPPTLNWDMWLGVAPVRPYLAMYPKGHPVYGPPPEKAAQSNYKAAGLDPVPPVGVVYHPFVWRGWKDFGTGKLGDQAGHAWNVIVWALGLGPIASAEVLEVSGMTKEQYPDSSIIRFDWAQRGIHPPFKLFWYDGTKRPAKEITGEGGRGGLTWIGTKGSLPPGRGPFLGQKTEPYPTPLQREWGRHEVHLDWCNAIKTGKQAPCDFGYAGPYAESYLLGDIALRVGQRIEWDPVAFQITNSREANQLLRREYRKGWDIREIAGSAFNV